MTRGPYVTGSIAVQPEAISLGTTKYEVAEEQRMLAASNAAAVLLQAVTILERGWYDPTVPDIAELLDRLTVWVRSFRVAPAVRQRKRG